MLKYILKRLVYIVIVAFILSFFLYTIYNFIDIDYAALRLQGQEVQLQKEGRYPLGVVARSLVCSLGGTRLEFLVSVWV